MKYLLIVFCRQISFTVYRHLKTSDIHPCATRNNEHGKLNIPSVYTRRYGKFSIKQQCILWNSSLSSCRQNFLNNAQNYPVTINNMTRNQYQKMLHKIFSLPI